ncbi:MAG: hypothetical protein K8R92_11915 [Planctomycetes bacterium]|nr:hypothetical protein [Planctomycetota bacterium]
MNSRNKMSMFCAVASMLALAPTAAADSVVFSDDTFPTAGWGFEVVGSGESTPSQVTSGGNPGAFRRIVQAVDPDTGWFFAFSKFGTNQSTRYVPSAQGAIESVDFSIQAQTVSVLNGIVPDLSMGIKQGGLIFVQNQFFSQFAGSWTTYSHSGLIPADFTCINGIGGESLDFSNSGAPIRFGFVSINGSFNGASTGGVFEYDNYQVTVNIAPPPCFGDLDGSGEVDGGDIGLVLLDFGPCPGCTTDLDESGEVDGGDIGLVLLSFGACE